MGLCSTVANKHEWWRLVIWQALYPSVKNGIWDLYWFKPFASSPTQTRVLSWCYQCDRYILCLNISCPNKRVTHGICRPWRRPCKDVDILGLENLTEGLMRVNLSNIRETQLLISYTWSGSLVMLTCHIVRLGISLLTFSSKSKGIPKVGILWVSKHHKGFDPLDFWGSSLEVSEVMSLHGPKSSGHQTWVHIW